MFPLYTQSDRGPENNGIANGETMLRHRHDRSVVQQIFHKWKIHGDNVRSESSWASFRLRCAEGFEDIIVEGIEAGWIDFSCEADV